MKKVIVSITCIFSILLVLLNINKITTNITHALYHPSSNKVTQETNYYQNQSYNFVKNTTDFTPLGKQDLLDIIYTAINNGSKSFTFYCPKVYQTCISDINEFSNDANLLTHLNNFVHPYNSFTSIKTTISDSGEINFTIKYLYTKEEIATLNQEIKKLLPTLLAQADKLNENETDKFTIEYNKIKVIHDYIINNTKYDLDNNKELKSYNAYGALINHIATCNGYTDLMALFLTEMGYENFKVATTNGTSENSKGHVWNAVKVNDEWLHLDLTWDDPVSSDNKDYLYHKYFLINTEELFLADSNITSEEHNFDPAIYSELKSS